MAPLETGAERQGTRSSHELDAPPWRRVDGTLMATARAIRLTYDTALAELHLSLPEASLLAFVLEAGPVSQSEIAGKLDAGRAATGLRIDGLERNGLVRRLAHPTDRRVWLVEATDAGRALVERINQIDWTIRTRLRAGISREQRAQLADVLVQIQGNAFSLLEDLKAEPPAPGSPPA